MNEQPQQTKRPAKASFHEPPLPKSSMVIWIIGLGLWCSLYGLLYLNWKKFLQVRVKLFHLLKQIIQSLEGGILTKLDVKER